MRQKTFGALPGLLLVNCLGGGLLAQTLVDLRSQTKQVDFTAAAFTRPVKTGTTTPATCVVGDLFFRTNAVAGQNLFGCSTANNWSLLGFAGSITPFNDLRVLLTSAQQLTIGDTCSVPAPCNVRIGSTVIQVVTPITATITAGGGTGIAKIYLTESGVVLVNHSQSAGLTVNCTTGCSTQQSAVPQYPANGIALANVGISAGTWSTVTDTRSMLNTRAIIAGQGIAITEAGGVATVEIDTADVARMGGSNDWVGANDFSAASTFRVKTGAGVPATGECNLATHAGRLYVRNDTGAANASLYVCASTAPGAYSWEPNAVDCMSESSVCLKDDFPYTGSSNSYSELGWRSIGTPGYAASHNSGTRIGIVRFTPSGADTVNSFYHDAGAANGGYINPSLLSNFELVFIWQPDTLSSDYQYSVGVSTDGTMGGADAAMVRLADSTGCSANFTDAATLRYIARSSGTATTSTSGVTVSAGQWLKTRIRKLAGETQLRFSVSVNGGAYSADTTIGTNVPNAGLLPFFQVTSCSAGEQTLNVDYFRFAAKGVAR